MKNETYEEFVEKFKPKKTTDDCITPPEIYEVVKDWACEKYGIGPECIVRPFWPGGDYEHYPYADGCVVLDNPPFSILSRICEFYLVRNIKFFLFAPTLTVFGGRRIAAKINHIICDYGIIYDNGAIVNTSFVTNCSDGIIAQTAPDLVKAIRDKTEEMRKRTRAELPKYSYPECIITAATLGKYANYGIDFCIRAKECVPIHTLDAQRQEKKGIFGGGLLLSEKATERRAAAEKAAKKAAKEAKEAREAAEKAARYVWELSEREREIVESLGEE